MLSICYVGCAKLYEYRFTLFNRIIKLVKNPWVHGLNKSRVPSHNGSTIYLVAN